MARKKIVAGNWKMNKTPSEAVALCNELKDLVKSDAVDVVYCVPAIDIVPVVEAVKGTNVKVGAENMYFEDKGAFTGEISAPMLKDAGVEFRQISAWISADPLDGGASLDGTVLTLGPLTSAVLRTEEK